MSSSDIDGLRTFTIDFKDYAGNNGVQVTSVTDGSSVIFDKTKPTLTSVTIESDNISDNALASTGSTITVRFTSSESLLADSVIATVAGNPATVSNTSGNNWIAEYVMTGSEPQGIIPFTINF
jgi:hypothetical protein